jgi:hypothetical protein
MSAHQASLTEMARIRVLTRELIALLDGVTKDLPTHRPRTLAATRHLMLAIKALPGWNVPDVDLAGVFENLDGAGKSSGSNSVTASAE